MKLRKWNRIIHRDMGYIFFGMSVIYGLSGIALNHLDDWNPNYIIKIREVILEDLPSPGPISKQEASGIVDRIDKPMASPNAVSGPAMPTCVWSSNSFMVFRSSVNGVCT